MTLPEISGVLCIFTTRNPKTSALTNVRKKGPGPLPSQHCACPTGAALRASDLPRTPVCLLSSEQKFRFDALIFYNHRWIRWGDEHKSKTKQNTKIKDGGKRPQWKPWRDQGEATMCTLHEIWTDGRRSLRDHGGVWSKITVDINSLSGFLKDTWE